MTYLLVSVPFVGIAVLALAIALWRRPDRGSLVRRWRMPVLVAGVAVMALTAVFDNLMIAAGLMIYSDQNTSGLVIGLAPVEDFAYPLAGLILLPAVWLLSRPPAKDQT